MEEEREQTAGLFTELNIHNQFDWVENTTGSPSTSPQGLSKRYMNKMASENAHKTPFKNNKKTT